ncbi:CaiB/BaiF CoA transferase family protein [Streptomyces coffeae]|uniref:CoA transferase n=1 Tax=Streptomyces coffeae TaxID=621382 RepID=A0ABS1NNB5_9ACTN|nr:CaiB/BaiF CoA-transferase family protein [Streptomyces coffeae]MBL1101514.1 CoA transferase [Streptomyces coffeae]
MTMTTHPAEPGTAFLQGVRVLDVTGALAGPYCTTILSDLGADVLKIEPTTGDTLRARRMGPDRRPIPFDLVHRDKRSLAVDLKSPEGAGILRSLARRSDVLVENFRAGAMRRLGLGYEDLRTDCPDLVYCSISGFGQFGPLRDAKGIDLIAQAYGGLMSVTGSTDGQLAKAGFPISDVGTGMWGAIGVLAALLRARAGGGGAHVDVALADAVASWSLWEVADYVATGIEPAPLGTAHRLAAPYEAFACSDGATLVLGAVDRAWQALCGVLDIDLSEDARFATEYERFLHRVPLAEILQARFATAPRNHWMEALRTAGVPCGPVNGIGDILTDEQFATRGLFVHDEPRFGERTIVNTPIVSDGAPRARGPAPALGENTVAVLSELGYDGERITALVEAGVVGAALDSAEAQT